MPSRALGDKRAGVEDVPYEQLWSDTSTWQADAGGELTWGQHTEKTSNPFLH